MNEAIASGGSRVCGGVGSSRPNNSLSGGNRGAPAPTSTASTAHLLGGRRWPSLSKPLLALQWLRLWPRLLPWLLSDPLRTQSPFPHPKPFRHRKHLSCVKGVPPAWRFRSLSRLKPLHLRSLLLLLAQVNPAARPA